MKQKRILLIRPDRVGDVILTTPLIKAIKQTYPDSYLALMVSAVSVPLLENNPNVDKIIIDEQNSKNKNDFWDKVKLLRSEKFTTGLMPLPRERHAWMMFFAGIKERIGVGKILYEVLTGMKTVPKKYIPLRHEADYIFDLGRKIGVKDIPLKPELFLSDSEIYAARNKLTNIGLDLSKPIIGVNPISGGSVPNWKIEDYIKLVNKLAKIYQILFLLPSQLPKLTEAFANTKNVFFKFPDLRNLISICSQLSLLFSSSTGTSHIAAALGIKTVTLFCPLDTCSAQHWGNLGNESINLTATNKYCQIKCPGNPKICTLDEVTFDNAYSAIISSLSK